MRAVSVASYTIKEIIIYYQSHGLGCGPAGNSSAHILSLHSDKMRNKSVIRIFLVLNVRMVVLCSRSLATYKPHLPLPKKCK